MINGLFEAKYAMLQWNFMLKRLPSAATAMAHQHELNCMLQVFLLKLENCSQSAQ
jgi:hypothetical protein